MKVFKFYVEGLERDDWLYITEELAREVAETSLKDNITPYQMEWREDMMNAMPSREDIENGTMPRQIPSGEYRLYFRGRCLDKWEATAYLVGPVEVFEEANF